MMTKSINDPMDAEPTVVGLSRSESKVSTDSLASSVRTGTSGQYGSGNWGWFEDVHGAELLDVGKNDDKTKEKKGRLLQQFGDTMAATLNEMVPRVVDNDVGTMGVTAPTYVLEESLSSQLLWKDTAGNRPPQPVEERAFYEQMWKQNFERSHVDYQMPVDVLTASSPISLSPFADGNFDAGGHGAQLSNYNLAPCDARMDTNATDAEVAEAIHRMHGSAGHDFTASENRHTVVKKRVRGTGSDGDLTVLIKGDNVFGTTVSKSFPRSSRPGGAIDGVDTVNISVAGYRVVESKKYGKYAQYLVIYREGSIRDTIGVWKRFSDFDELGHKITHAHQSCSSVLANMSPMAITEEPDVEHLPNAITSWRLLKKRQRWYRCLDAGYLSLKVFLLERFLHDILFESSSPTLLRDFVGSNVAGN